MKVCDKENAPADNGKAAEVSEKLLLDLGDMMHVVNDQEYEQDEDTCTNKDLEEMFQFVYTQFKQMKISSDSYCTKIQSDSTFSKLAVCLSNSEINVLQADELKSVIKFKPHEKEITGCRFSPQNDNLIYTSSEDGIVKLFDIRSNKSEKEFKEKEEEKKPFSAFDVSINDRILCAGTELVDEDAFLLFWDIRGTKLLGGYWQSHSDEITAVKFNDTNPDLMASGSVDGLINLFDVSKDNEDSAFTYCLNTGGTINNITWEAGERNQKFLFSVADACKLDYWNIEESVPSKRFAEKNIAEAVRRKLPEESYIVSIFCPKKSNPIILVGSGMQTDGRVCLRSLTFNRNTMCLESTSRFVLNEPEKKMPVIRAALHHSETDNYIMAAEDGSLSVWSQDKESKNGLKMPGAKSKSRRSKPY